MTSDQWPEITFQQAPTNPPPILVPRKHYNIPTLILHYRESHAGINRRVLRAQDKLTPKGKTQIRFDFQFQSGRVGHEFE